VTWYFARRLFYSLFVIWGAVTIIFVIVRLLPGDPALVLLGPAASPEQLAAARARLGLDDPLLVQYWRFVVGAAQLDFGQSIRLGGSATGHVLQRLPATVRLGLTSMAMSLAMAFPLGIAAARRPQSWRDKLISGFSLLGQSLPTFWVGIMLILLLARTFQVLPSSGSETWQHLLMPAFTLALPFTSLLVRLVRSGLLEVMNEDYVRTARSKGLGEQAVIYGHAIQNMLIPVVTVVGLQLGVLLGGTVIVETVFAWPGIGRLLIQAIFNRDFPIVQSVITLVAMTFVFLNFAVDLLYGYLDPRIRIGGNV
jgi:peptide/nickel transport system permease protein